MSDDKIAEIRARHDGDAKIATVLNPQLPPSWTLAGWRAHDDRATLLAEVERLTRERDEARAEIERTHALLKDPNAVVINILRGVIALPSADQIRHIYQQTLEAHP